MLTNSAKLNEAQIIELYEARDENAIAQTATLYGTYCQSIAMNILANEQDAQEVVNDTYLKAWQHIPPEKPQKLSAYLGRIARNLSLDRYKARATQKRGGGDGECETLLSELELCIPSACTVESQVDCNELSRTIDAFLRSLPNRQDAAFFLRRYWYGESVAQIAQRYNAGVSCVKTSLHRTRGKLKSTLEKENLL